MSWPNIRLIFFREMRDQLRDRRTLFMIAVLPMLFYPLLGVSFLQIAQFITTDESRILVVGEESVKEIPGLLDGDSFAAGLIDEDVVVVFELLDDIAFYREHREQFESPDGLPEDVKKQFIAHLRTLMAVKDCHAVLYYPPGIANKLKNFAEEYAARYRAGEDTPSIPQPIPIGAIDSDKRAVATSRMKRLVHEHADKTRKNAARSINAPKLAEPTNVQVLLDEDPQKRINTSLWSKILPFVLIIWAVTGAFYPAVDLCAGEKERGTLETLLSSPARRSEIVMGKLFTVMLFSISTALLNLLIMFSVSSFVLSKISTSMTLANVGPPPVAALFWSVLVIVPVSILVSAVCLALAALAKSTKEGQHYLAPVMLVALPLTLLPMAPQVELNFGFSLIPISGIVLVMRSLLEGTIVDLWPYAIIVAVVTFFCCWWSVRWAIEQFNSESVMFSAGERWSVGTWMRQLARDRQLTPTVAQALLCGLVILIVRFFLMFFMAEASDDLVNAANRVTEPAQRVGLFWTFFQHTFISIVVGVALPALLMAVMLTRSPRRTLLLDQRPRWITIPVAAVLALAAVPLVRLMSFGIKSLLPPLDLGKFEAVLSLLDDAPNVFMALALIAVLPAVFEELTFRGVILSGFRHTGRKWRAIVLSSLFFALAHGLLQQEVNAFVLGLVLGYIAVQTGSIWPCIVFHFVSNATQYLLSCEKYFMAKHVGAITSNPSQWIPIVVVSAIVCSLLIYYLHRLPYRRTREEDLVDAIQRESAKPPSPETSA